MVNLSDPDTQSMKGMRCDVQGYNAQAVVDDEQIVLAAEITNDPGDFSHLRPMIRVTDPRPAARAGGIVSTVGVRQLAVADEPAEKARRAL